jgi:hypothetical protein
MFGFDTREILGRPKSIALLIGASTFTFYVTMLASPKFLSGYDSGVYLGASIHFVSGLMPYKDFTFVQPPGIVLLLSPISVLSRMVGTHDAFEYGRVLSCAISASNALLLAYVVRSRGRLAMVIAGYGLAFMPAMVYEADSVKLETFLTFFTLLGLLVVSREGARGSLSNRELLLAGVFIGLAGVVKLWAVVPATAVVVCLLPAYRGRIAIFLGATAATFTACCLPFFVADPHGFISQVITDQIGRPSTSGLTLSTLGRLGYVTGLKFISKAVTYHEIEVFVLEVVLIAAIGFYIRAEKVTTDWILAVSSILGILLLLIAPETFIYYACFTAPFLAGVAGVVAGTLYESGRDFLRRTRWWNPRRSWPTILISSLCVLTFAAMSLQWISTYRTTSYVLDVPVGQITRLVPPGVCAVFDTIFYALESNRFSGSSQNCPVVVDPTGMSFTFPSNKVGPNMDYVRLWRHIFARSSVVVLESPTTRNVPWNDELTKWFRNNFALTYGKDFVYIYTKIPARRDHH